MKQKSLLKVFFLLCALIVGSTSVWADTYVKVTSAPTDWSGEYVILYESSTTAYVWTGVDANSNYVTASISNNAITKPDGAVTVTIASMTGGYSIKVNGGNNNGKYISGTSGSNTTNFNDNAVANTLTYNSGVDIASNTSHFVMQFTTNTKRYRYYKSATYSGDNYKRPQLYKFVPTLTYSVDPSASGTISVKNSGNNVNSGSTVASGTTLDIVATPGSGMQFKNWTVTGTGSSVEYPTSATTTFTMGSANSTLTANFESALAYTITAIANDDAYGEVNVAGATITATPNSGYKVPTTDGYDVTAGNATVTNNGDGTFTVDPSTDCTVQINFEEKDTPEFSFASATASATYGGTVTPPALTNNESTGAVTYASNNEAVATVDANSGDVTIVSVGTARITATVAEDDDYKTAQASYNLTVNENTNASGAQNSIVILNEGFSSFNSKGGRDSDYGNGSGTFSASNCDYTSWTGASTIYAAYSCVRIGSGSSNGTITTGNLNVSGSATLTFELAGWGNDSNFNFDVSGTNCTLSGNKSLTQSTTPSIAASTWKSYSVDVSVTNAENPIKLTFSGKRLFFDSIQLSENCDYTFVDATIPSSGWGTFCSPYALDLGNSNNTCLAYTVSDYDATAGTITVQKQTGKVAAKTPLLVYAENETGSSITKKLVVTNEAGSAVDGNKLRGFLSPTYYAGATAEETLLGMSGGTFKKLSAGTTLKANRAALVMTTEDFDKLPTSGDTKLTFIIEDETETDGINSHRTNFVKYDGNAYNLNGQRVGNDFKGIVIVNGKKVVRK